MSMSKSLVPHFIRPIKKDATFFKANKNDATFCKANKNDARPASGGEKVDWEGEAAVQGQEEVSHLNDNFWWAML